MTDSINVEFTDQELRTVVAALWDKVLESERYRNSAQTPREPAPEDTCCDAHLNRWKRNREIYLSLVERATHERALVRMLEALIDPTPTALAGED